MAIVVSVVVPAYNAAEFLARTIRSVSEQTHRELEIIIVDDGSTDDTASIAAGLAANDPRISVISQVNAGVAAARNAGLAAAKGEFVAFVDADDLWHPAKIERQLYYIAASKPGYAAVTCLSRFIDRNDFAWDVCPYFSMFDAYSLPSMIVVHPTGNGSAIMVRRDVALAVGGYDSSYARNDCGGCEDIDFEIKISENYPVAYVPEYLVGYRRYDGSMSGNKARMIRAMEAVTEERIAASPGLPRWVATQARVTSFQFAITMYARAGMYKHAATAAARLFMTRPTALLERLLVHYPRRFFTLAFRKLFPQQTVHVDPNVAPFRDLAPVPVASRAIPFYETMRCHALVDADRKWRTRATTGRQTPKPIASEQVIHD